MDLITIAAKTHPGMKRGENQDHFGFFMPEDGHIPEKGILAAVADGMGGHFGGATASRMAINVLISEFYRTGAKSIPESLNAAFQKANMAIYDKGQSNSELKGMGTTLSAAVFKDDKFFWAHVGDSRGYIIHKNQTRQFTNDHSYVAELLMAGVITRSEASTHSKKNVITRAVGVSPILKVDISSKHGRLKMGQYVLLCSDGLSKVVSDEQVVRTINRLRSPAAVCDNLISAANRLGGPDNITVVVIRKNRDVQNDTFIKNLLNFQNKTFTSGGK